MMLPRKITIKVSKELKKTKKEVEAKEKRKYDLIKTQDKIKQGKKNDLSAFKQWKMSEEIKSLGSETTRLWKKVGVLEENVDLLKKEMVNRQAILGVVS